MPNQADRETAAERLGVEVPADELARIENSVTVARYLAETCLGGVGYTPKPNEVIPVAARIYAAALAAGAKLSDAAASVRVEYEARDVQAERNAAEMEAQREAAKQERAEQAARDAKNAVLGK